MPDRRPIEIPFPFKGLNTNWAFRRQPEGTTPDALNVRPYDAIDNRLRGGQRSGTSKYFDDAVNGSNSIQRLDQITIALDPESIVPDTLLFSEDFDYSDGALETVSSGAWTGLSSITIPAAPVTFSDDATVPIIASNLIQGKQVGDSKVGMAINETITNPGTSYVLQATVRFDIDPAGSAGADPHMGFALRVDGSYADGLASNEWVWAGIRGDEVGGQNRYYIGVRFNVTGDSDEYRITDDYAYNATFWNTTHDLKVTVSLNTVRVYLDEILYAEYTSSILSANTRWGIVCGDAANDSCTAFTMDSIRVWTGVPPASLRRTELIAVSGGTIKAGDADTGLTTPIDGDSALGSGDIVSSQAAYQKMYFCDGATSSYQVYNPATDTVSSWAPLAGQLPGGGTGTSYDVTDIDVDNNQITATGASAAFADGDLILWRDCIDPKNNKVYEIETDEGGDVLTLTETINSDPGDSDTYGEIVAVDVACRFMTLYRGRIVLYGLYTDPQNWFMSAVGDPLDWDYSPDTITETQAIAGNNSDAGLLGDVLKCCAPFSDDLMVMGGDHTLWLMAGDPAAGGRIDNISYQIGIAGAEAFTYDPSGMMYFLSNEGLWRMRPGITEPEPVSRNRADSIFTSIDYETYYPRLLWDNERVGLHIFLTPFNQPTTAPIHYYYDQRTDSFWADQYPAAHGPTAVLVFDADAPDDRAFLIGGYDGYIRYLDDTATTDDSTVINSYVLITPITFAGDLANTRLTEIVPILSEDSDPVRLEVYANDTAEQVIEATSPRFVRTLTAGRNPSVRQRANGNTIMLKLINDSSTARRWALESMTGIIQISGKARHGRL